MPHPTPAGPTAAAVPPPPDTNWFCGTAGDGAVQLRIHYSATDARVDLYHGWRSRVGPDLLGAAVLQALGTATAARATAWALDQAEAATTHAGPPARPATGRVATREAVDKMLRAFRDPREFRAQLAELGQQSRVVSGPGREVTVVARGGQVVDLRLDPGWRRTATDSDLERRLADGLHTALQQCAAIPTQALDGCPDLVAVLAGQPAGPPFPLPDTRGDR